MTSKAQPLVKPEGLELHHISGKNPWTFSYCIPSRPGKSQPAWEKYLHTLHDFSYFEDFFAIYNSIEKPSNLPKACRYYVFQKGIKPLWEDPANQEGMQYTIEYTNPKDNSKDSSKDDTKGEYVEAQEKWLELVLSVFCSFPKDKVNGIEFNNRGETTRLGVWTRKLDNEKDVEDIKKKFIEVIGEEKASELKIQPMGVPTPATQSNPKRHGNQGGDRGHRQPNSQRNRSNQKPKNGNKNHDHAPKFHH